MTARCPTSRPAVTWCLVLTALVAASVGGCSVAAPDDAPTGATAPAEPSERPVETAPAPGPTAPADVTVTATSGPVTLEVTVPEVAAPDAAGTTGAGAVVVTPADEGATDLTLALADGPATLSVASGSLERHADGTLTVLDDAGAPVGGLTAPRVAGRHGEPRDVAAGTDGTAALGTPNVHVEIVDARHAQVTLAPAAGTTSGSGAKAGSATDGGATGTTADDDTGTWDVVASLGTQAVRSTDWGEREGGRSLAVDATAWARVAGQAGQDLVWAQVVAVEPEADTPTMHDQLVCHAVGAPDKATWNLEPWRPDVGLLATMAARCNAT